MFAFYLLCSKCWSIYLCLLIATNLYSLCVCVLLNRLRHFDVIQLLHCEPDYCAMMMMMIWWWCDGADDALVVGQQIKKMLSPLMETDGNATHTHTNMHVCNGMSSTSKWMQVLIGMKWTIALSVTLNHHIYFLLFCFVFWLFNCIHPPPDSNCIRSSFLIMDTRMATRTISYLH